MLQDVFTTEAAKMPDAKAAQLFAAVSAVDRRAVRTLLEEGVSPNLRDDEGNTPLMKAAQFDNRMTIAGMLLGRGADVHAVNQRGETALHIACNAGEQITRLLLTFDADPLVIEGVAQREKLLFLAVAGGNAKAVDVLVDAGIAPTITNTNQETLLYVAAKSGDAKMAEKVLALGVSPNALTAKGYSPLRAAMSNQNPALEEQYLECIKVLVAARSNPYNEVNDRAGWSDNTHIDHGYAENLGGQIAAVVGAAKKEFDLIGNARLPSAALVSGLLAQGVDCNAMDDKGNHALHAVLTCRDVRDRAETLKVLLDAKASVEKPTASGEFPLGTAARMGDPESVKALLDAGASHSPAAPGQPYPLHLAIQSGNVECVRLLIEAGASTFTKDGRGDTPFDYAKSVEHTHEKIFDLVADKRDVELKSWAEDSVRTTDSTSGMKRLKFKAKAPS